MSGPLQPMTDPGWWLRALFLLNLAAYLLGAWAIVDILRRRKEPMAMLSWILGILLVPVLGAPLYYLIGERKVQRRGRKKRRRSAPIVRAIRSVEARDEGAAGPQSSGAGSAVDESMRQLAELSTKLGPFPLRAGNKLEAFLTAQETYEDILRSIETARHHVHLEYYIFRPDGTGRMFLDALVRKAREGVEVRLLLDGIGSWGTSDRFFRPLVEAGGRVETFLPALPWRRPWHLNCRNHRKIVVVDAKVAYTGSQNIGDEYRGRWREVGPWKDTHLRLEGPAVRELQEVFVEDWYYAAREELTSLKYLRRQPPAGASVVQVVPTGPDQEGNVLAHIFFEAIALARTSIRISTPYFVPDPGLIVALQNAAYRGVEVEILIPSRTDSRLVLWAGRSFYQELVRSGVKIHEFRHGMLHSKTVTIDDKWTLISSANMDVRSFLLNFEVTASIFDERIARRLLHDFRESLARSEPVRPVSGRGPFWPGLLEGVARLMAPML
ncbi:MAG: cardiolipin synthase [Planctomycetes bacterium]|nr:cardiolipin synthase [Planctomycetota bacterium]